MRQIFFLLFITVLTFQGNIFSQDAPIGYTEHYGLRKWAENANPSADSLNANWDDLDMVLFDLIVTTDTTELIIRNDTLVFADAFKDSILSSGFGDSSVVWSTLHPDVRDSIKNVFDSTVQWVDLTQPVKDSINNVGWNELTQAVKDSINKSFYAWLAITDDTLVVAAGGTFITVKGLGVVNSNTTVTDSTIIILKAGIYSIFFTMQVDSNVTAGNAARKKVEAKVGLNAGITEIGMEGWSIDATAQSLIGQTLTGKAVRHLAVNDTLKLKFTANEAESYQVNHIQFTVHRIGK